MSDAAPGGKSFTLSEYMETQACSMRSIYTKAA